MGQGLHRRGVHRQQRIEQVRQPDAVRFRDEPEQISEAVKTPRPPRGCDLKRGLVVAVQQLAAELAGSILVGEVDHLRAEPLDADDSGKAICKDAFDRGAGSQIFKTGHKLRACWGVLRAPAHWSTAAVASIRIDVVGG